MEYSGKKRRRVMGSAVHPVVAADANLPHRPTFGMTVRVRRKWKTLAFFLIARHVDQAVVNRGSASADIPDLKIRMQYLIQKVPEFSSCTTPGIRPHAHTGLPSRDKSALPGQLGRI